MRSAGSTEPPRARSGAGGARAGAQLRAELLELRTTRTNGGLLIGMVLLVLLETLLQGLLSHESDLVQKSSQGNLLGFGGVAIFFAALVGVLAVTSEFRFGTIRPTLLFEPRRERLVGAKLVAAFLLGLAFGAVAEGLCLAIGFAVLHGRGIDVALTNGELLQVGLGTVAVSALWAGIGLGLGVGAIVRHQVGAIVGLLAWLFIAEQLLFGLVLSVGRYAPGIAARAVSGDTAQHLVGTAAGVVLLVAWTVGLTAVGAALMLRRDVD